MTFPSNTLTQLRLQELLSYDPETGIFRWIVGRRGHAVTGKPAGHRSKAGYNLITIDGVRYQAHRLAFLYMEGAFPPNDVDHINGARTDNRFRNLRHATRSENLANKIVTKLPSSGVKGAYFHPKTRKFTAAIKINGRIKYLGIFATAEQAGEVYDLAAIAAFGEFATTNKELKNV